VLVFLFFAIAFSGPNYELNLWLEYGKSADVFFSQGKFEKAEEYYWKAIQELASSGPYEQSVDPNISRFTRIIVISNKTDLMQRSFHKDLERLEKEYGPSHPSLCLSLSLLGQLYNASGQYEKATMYFERTLKIHESFSKDSPELAYLLNYLAFFYNAGGQYDRAEPMYLRSRTLRIKRVREDPLNDELAQVNYAYLLLKAGRNKDAEAAFQRVIKALKEEFDPKHPNLITVQKQFEKLSRLP
jgi:tetratricopeptide (TPR) repeat protein